MPTDYRSGILSFFKASIKDYNQGYYDDLFEPNGSFQKKYCFAPYVPIGNINHQNIALSLPKMSITISTGDPYTGMMLYNAFQKQKGQQHHFYSDYLTLEKITLLPDHQLNTQNILVKTMSPILIRKHNRSDNSDHYFLLSDGDEAIQCLQKNTRYQLETMAPALLPYVDTLKIEPFNLKKVVVHHYGMLKDAMVGTFKLSGHTLLLQHIYDYGIGSHRSAGFGLIDVLQEVVSE